MYDELQEYLTESREALLRAATDEEWALAYAALTEARLLNELAQYITRLT